MATCNAKVTAPLVNGAQCTVTIQLRAVSTDPDPVRSFSFTFPITDSLADIKRRAKERIAEEWTAYLAEAARKTRAAAVVAAVSDASFDVNW